MFKRTLYLLALFLCSESYGETNLDVFETITHGPLSELSGLVKSKRFPNVIWAHNDSGDIARLFALTEKGEVIFPGFLDDEYFTNHPVAGKAEWPGHIIYLAANLDWEDIAIDEEFIYIADTGNNGNARRDLGVYVVPEPNPRAVAESRMLKYLPVRYPEQEAYPAEVWHYDNEALFIYKEKLHFLTKHRKPGKVSEWESGTKLYRLDTQYTDRFNMLVKVDERADLHVATGADLSPDGENLAVLAYSQLWVFSKPGRKGKWLSGESRLLTLTRKNTRQIEAVCWLDNETLLIGNENRDLFKVRLSDIPPVES